jgi:hypothetical protein
MTTLKDLPVEIHLQILRFLPCTDILNLLVTSTDFAKFLVHKQYLISSRISDLHAPPPEFEGKPQFSQIKQITTFEQLGRFERVVEQAKHLYSYRARRLRKCHPLVKDHAIRTFTFSLWLLDDILQNLSRDNAVPRHDNRNPNTSKARLWETLESLTDFELQHVYGTFMFLQSLLYRVLHCDFTYELGCHDNEPRRASSTTIFEYCGRQLRPRLLRSFCAQCYQTPCNTTRHKNTIDMIIQNGLDYTISILGCSDIDALVRVRTDDILITVEKVVKGIDLPLLLEFDLEILRRELTPHTNCGPFPLSVSGEPGPIESIFISEALDSTVSGYDLWRFGPLPPNGLTGNQRRWV